MKEQLTLDGSQYSPPKSDDWETPGDLFKQLNKEFNFTLDPCCQKETAKCEKYYTVEDSGLKHSWKNDRVFMNPPYSDITTWLKKVWIERKQGCELVVCLLPVWTDRWWFHEFIYPNKAEIRFLQGRLKFLLNGLCNKSPPFGSMIVVFQ